MAELDKWIEISKECKYLPENDLKLLCEIVCDLLVRIKKIFEKMSTKLNLGICFRSKKVTCIQSHFPSRCAVTFMVNSMISRSCSGRVVKFLIQITFSWEISSIEVCHSVAKP